MIGRLEKKKMINISYSLLVMVCSQQKNGESNRNM